MAMQTAGGKRSDDTRASKGKTCCRLEIMPASNGGVIVEKYYKSSERGSTKGAPSYVYHEPDKLAFESLEAALPAIKGAF